MEPKLEFAFTIHLKLDQVMVLPAASALGYERAAIGVAEGDFEGPNIRGRVVPHSGADWASVRPDGTLDFDARYLLETDDGTLIYVQNRGYRWAPPEVMKRMAERQEVAPSEYYMRVSPKFEVAQGPHDWLARHIFVGIGERTRTGNSIHYYKLL